MRLTDSQFRELVHSFAACFSTSVQEQLAQNPDGWNGEHKRGAAYTALLELLDDYGDRIQRFGVSQQLCFEELSRVIVSGLDVVNSEIGKYRSTDLAFRHPEGNG